jgi:predicted nuclease with TOPRIM domain
MILEGKRRRKAMNIEDVIGQAISRINKEIQKTFKKEKEELQKELDELRQENEALRKEKAQLMEKNRQLKSGVLLRKPYTELIDDRGEGYETKTKIPIAITWRK